MSGFGIWVVLPKNVEVLYLDKKVRNMSQSIPRSHLKSYLLSIRDQGEHPPRITSHLLDCKKDKLRIGHSQNYFSFHFFKHRDFS